MSILSRIFKRTDQAPVPRPALPPSNPHLDAWANAVTGLGTFNGASNFDVFVGRCTKSYVEADDIYAFSGVMARLITLGPMTCFAKGFCVEKLEPADADALKTTLTNLSAFRKMCNAAILANQYGGAVIYMRIDDGLSPDQPVNMNNIRSVSGLVVFDSTEVSVQEYGTNIDSPYYGEPVRYQISSMGTTFAVHASRILHFDAFPISRQMRIRLGGFSPSLIDRVWDAFSSYGSTNAYFRETIKKLTQGVLKLNGVAAGSTTANKGSIFNRLRELMKNMSTIGDVILDSAGEDYSTSNRNIQGFADAANIFVDWLVAEGGIPRSMLMLQTQGGLSDGSNDGDHKYWAKSCASDQANRYAPLAEKLLRYIFASKMTPVRDVPHPFYVEWPPIAQMTEKEEAEIYQMMAAGRAADVTSAVISPMEARRSEDVQKIFKLDSEDAIPSYTTPTLVENGT